MKEEDEELERIKQKKLKELMSKIHKEKESGVKTISKPVKVTDSNFAEFVKSYPLVVVDCWAPWCGPCLFLSPIIEELAKSYAGKIVFGKLNVDENQQVALQYGIMSIPTLLVFKNGRLVDRIVGAMPRKMLESKLTRYL